MKEFRLHRRMTTDPASSRPESEARSMPRGAASPPVGGRAAETTRDGGIASPVPTTSLLLHPPVPSAPGVAGIAPTQTILNVERFQLYAREGVHVELDLSGSGQAGNTRLLDARIQGIVGVVTEHHWPRLILGGAPTPAGGRGPGAGQPVRPAPLLIPLHPEDPELPLRAGPAKRNPPPPGEAAAGFRLAAGLPAGFAGGFHRPGRQGCPLRSCNPSSPAPCGSGDRGRSGGQGALQVATPDRQPSA